MFAYASAQAGTPEQATEILWIPVCAGMTGKETVGRMNYRATAKPLHYPIIRLTEMNVYFIVNFAC
jgi:hypothetical protein